MNLIGLCIGTAIGTIFHAVLYIFIVLSVRWEEEAVSASTNSSSSDLSNVPRFSFYSILNNREEDIEMVNLHPSSSSATDLETKNEMDISTHGKENDENLKIFRWRKVSMEHTGKNTIAILIYLKLATLLYKPSGWLSNVFKIFGMKSAKKETRYELVDTDSQNNSNGDVIHDSTDESNEDDDDFNAETVVVFRRVPNTAMALPIEGPSHRPRIAAE